MILLLHSLPKSNLDHQYCLKLSSPFYNVHCERVCILGKSPPLSVFAFEWVSMGYRSLAYPSSFSVWDSNLHQWFQCTQLCSGWGWASQRGQLFCFVWASLFKGPVPCSKSIRRPNRLKCCCCGVASDQSRHWKNYSQGFDFLICEYNITITVGGVAPPACLLTIVQNNSVAKARGWASQREKKMDCFGCFIMSRIVETEYTWIPN